MSVVMFSVIDSVHSNWNINFLFLFLLDIQEEIIFRSLFQYKGGDFFNGTVALWEAFKH